MALSISGNRTASMLALKFRGCLLGALAGDCLGRPFELDAGDSPTPRHLRRVEAFFSKLSDRAFASGSLPYTDDTAMTKTLAASLIDKQRLDVRDLAQKFADEYFDDPERGYGCHVTHVFEEVRKNPAGDVLAPARGQFDGKGSYGNGAAMRAAPVALFFHADTQRMMEAARQSGLVTHAHVNGYDGAVLQCLAVQKALLSDPATDPIDPPAFVRHLRDTLQQQQPAHEQQQQQQQQDGSSSRPLLSALDRVEELLLRDPPPPIAVVASILGNDITAQRSVPTALFAFLFAQQPVAEFQVDNAFERTLRYAIALGGDTDTIACMAGGICGAYLGQDALPAHLIEPCELREHVAELADRLLAAAHHAEGVPA